MRSLGCSFNFLDKWPVSTDACAYVFAAHPLVRLVVVTRLHTMGEIDTNGNLSPSERAFLLMRDKQGILGKTYAGVITRSYHLTCLGQYTQATKSP